MSTIPDEPSEVWEAVLLHHTNSVSVQLLINVCTQNPYWGQKMAIAGALDQGTLYRAEELNDDVLAPIEGTF